MNACQTPKIAGIPASLDATQPIRNEILPLERSLKINHVTFVFLLQREAEGSNICKSNGQVANRGSVKSGLRERCLYSYLWAVLR
ncbi:MAG: hypothetical protein WA579_01005, partial [Rhodomicrobium sp.]